MKAHKIAHVLSDFHLTQNFPEDLTLMEKLQGIPRWANTSASVGWTIKRRDVLLDDPCGDKELDGIWNIFGRPVLRSYYHDRFDR